MSTPREQAIAEAFRSLKLLIAPDDRFFTPTERPSISQVLANLYDAAAAPPAQGIETLRPRQPISDEESRALQQTMDGAKWANAFCLATGFPDEGWALTWFCNAIMAGFDEANRRQSAPAQATSGWDGERERLIRLLRQAEVAIRDFIGPFGAIDRFVEMQRSLAESEWLRGGADLPKTADLTGILRSDEIESRTNPPFGQTPQETKE